MLGRDPTKRNQMNWFLDRNRGELSVESQRWGMPADNNWRWFNGSTERQGLGSSKELSGSYLWAPNHSLRPEWPRVNWRTVWLPSWGPESSTELSDSLGPQNHSKECLLLLGPRIIKKNFWLPSLAQNHPKNFLAPIIGPRIIQKTFWLPSLGPESSKKLSGSHHWAQNHSKDCLLSLGTRIINWVQNHPEGCLASVMWLQNYSFGPELSRILSVSICILFRMPKCFSLKAWCQTISTRFALACPGLSSLTE